MVNPLIHTLPYLASGRWYALYAEALYNGASEEEAISQATASRLREAATEGFQPRHTARLMTRAVLRDAGGHPQTLTLSIAGGAASLKRTPLDDLRLSLHGDWPHIHRGAIEAVYGRTPYFPHFYPAISHLLTPPSIEEGQHHGHLTAGLHTVISSGLDIKGAVTALQNADAEARVRVAEEARSLVRECDMTLSALDILMKYGRRGALALLAGVFSLMVVLGLSVSSKAAPTDAPRLDLKVYTGYYHFVDEYGDTVRMTLIRDLYVYPPLKFKDKKQEEFYWRTVRDVRKTLPYAKLAFSTLCETYEYIQTIPDKKRREAHLKRLEHDIFEQYKPVMKNMTKSQGKILLKLINRETDQSSYSIVKAFLGSFRAGFWQTFGRFFGMNMKSGFDPEKNKEDATIDRIATLIEQGTL